MWYGAVEYGYLVSVLGIFIVGVLVLVARDLVYLEMTSLDFVLLFSLLLTSYAYASKLDWLFKLPRYLLHLSILD